MEQRYIRLLFSISLISITCYSFAQTPRGRIQINDGSLVTDRGSLLRGTYISTDIWDYVPSEDEISAIKDLGLNCIHLYAECAALHTPGERHMLVDSIVNMTERDSLYLVLTIGGCGEGGQFDSAFVNEFWRYYAPRYKDKTHLIYEIMNEPFEWSAPYDTLTIQKERRAYDIIRSLAPETHIQLMCYAWAINAESAILDIKLLGDIDWSNTSISTHGYATSSEELRPFLNTFIDSGYAITVTEFVSIENEYANLAYTRIFEEEFISYLHFVYLPELVNNPDYFKSPIESSEIRWTPDFGTWPISLTEIDYRDPFQEIEAAYYDEGSGIRILFLETNLGFIDNGDYVAYYNFDFTESPDSMIIKASSNNQQGGSISLFLDSLNGQYIGNYTINITGGWDNYEHFSFPVNKEIEGVRRIYFLFQGNNQYDFMNLKSFRFKKNDISINEQTYSSNNLTLTIYPNPASDYIRVLNIKKAVLEIYNMSGQLVIQKLVSEADNVISIADFPIGSYALKIITDSEVRSEILIVN